MSSPGRSPDYQLYRTVKTADSGSHTVKAAGLNCGEFPNVNIQLVVGAGDSVTAKFFSWSEASGAFIPVVDATTWGPYTVSTEITYPANGRILFVELKGTVANTAIYASSCPFA